MSTLVPKPGDEERLVSVVDTHLCLGEAEMGGVGEDFRTGGV
jgi:hypothetical protein